ncbi:LamG-like jellyroll fold domain-containing protein [Arthrobacter sp. 24S4-2]|uniref:LamG-like jellyroll fold domain-containing protein n=1 Tax=Arthrobacter sp. 24S4-2 TaxID=2575374 RepID=UPI0015860B88|nr:LamG-like jellyroll fold domain-containing protein [Arthrobacter sp. 24S4-2]
MTGAGTAPTLPASFGCNTPRFGEFVVVCPADGRSASVSLGAIDTVKTQLTVWSFDYAGNVNTQVKSTAASYSFTADHTANSPATVLSTTTSGAAWVDVETGNHVPVATPTCQSDIDPFATETSRALQLTGTTQSASTASSAVNTAESFSVSGWICPTAPPGPNDTTIQSLIAQMAGTGTTAGALRLGTAGYVEFDTWTSAGPPALEFVKRSPALAANTWNFVSAVYDKNNQQLRINVTSSGLTDTWTTATTTPNHLGSSGTQPVQLGGGFTGRILGPVMAQGVLTPQQFHNAQNNFGSSTEGVLK